LPGPVQLIVGFGASGIRIGAVTGYDAACVRAGDRVAGVVIVVDDGTAFWILKGD
jgi:hypothetical protein